LEKTRGRGKTEKHQGVGKETNGEEDRPVFLSRNAGGEPEKLRGGGGEGKGPSDTRTIPKQTGIWGGEAFTEKKSSRHPGPKKGTMGLEEC